MRRVFVSSDLTSLAFWYFPISSSQWVCHVTYECVVSCHVWMGHVACEWVTYEWVMSQLNMSCYVRMRLSCYLWNRTCLVLLSLDVDGRSGIFRWAGVNKCVMSQLNVSCYLWNRTYLVVVSLDVDWHSSVSDEQASMSVSCHMWIWCVVWHMDGSCRNCMRHVTYARNVPCPRLGWLRLVGPLKLEVCVAKETYKTDDILLKRPVILRSLLIVATPSLLTTTGILV